MEDNKALEVVEAEFVQLGTVRTSGPADVITQATGIATQLAAIVNSRKLYTVIRGKKHVRVEGWTTLGAMLGVLPREVGVARLDDGGYEAVVELVRASDGAVIGRGSALCGMDEPTWAQRPEYARRSMAVTRATGKAYRLGFSWIMTLAGYSPTPAEEMPDEESEKPKRKVTAKPQESTSPPHPARPAKKKANGNGRTWRASSVKAAMKEMGLTSYKVVGRLNLSTLDPGDADDVIFNWLKVYDEARATAEKDKAAIANAWLAGEMKDAEGEKDG